MMEEYKNKLELEAKKIEAEIREINKKWYQKPNVILSFLIFLTGVFSVGFLTKFTDIKSERLLLEKSILKHDIIIYEKKKDSINKTLDSLTIISNQLNDSINNLSIKYKMAEMEMKKNKNLIDNLIYELNQTKNNNKALKLKEKLNELNKNFDLPIIDVGVITTMAMNENDISMLLNYKEGYYKINVPIRDIDIEYIVEIMDVNNKIVYQKTFKGEKSFIVNIPKKKGSYFLQINSTQYSSFRVR